MTAKKASNDLAEQKARILERAEREKVKFMRLQFTDILGTIKNVEIPNRQFEDALDGEIMFDGSSIEGFVRIEESDMYLRPDLDTSQSSRGRPSGEKVGADDLRHLHAGRHTVRRLPADGAEACDRARRGAAVLDERRARSEFFLFQRRGGLPTTETHDAGGYFDLTPVDQGEDVRREIVLALEAMGFHVEAAHHEVAAGQHEIDFRYDDVLTTADNISTFRFVVKNVAMMNGLHATFMPKPIFGINGSGMHTHQSLFTDGKNAFYDARRAVAAQSRPACTTSAASCVTRKAFARSPIRWSIRTSGSCRGTRRRPTSRGPSAIAVRSCACRPRAAPRRASNCACRIPPAIPTWRSR